MASILYRQGVRGGRRPRTASICVPLQMFVTIVRPERPVMLDGLLVSAVTVSELMESVLFQDNLVHSLPSEEPRASKGFRKNLSGKWRRLVKKKPPQEVYTLPAELRDQLKTIYVY